ncbi:MAG: hypothetical protein QM500_10360 [Methylococcales bacterium]
MYRKLIILIVIFLPVYAVACGVNGERKQSVYATSAGKELAYWVVSSSDIQTLVMPSGFNVGIQIEPVTPEYYSTKADIGNFIPEMVKITVYDMSSTAPKKLSNTWGGSNSLQGYSSEGGADTVIELGSEGITLFLLKTICIKTGVAII